MNLELLSATRTPAAERQGAVRPWALRAPVIVAPMFLVSGPALVIASCRAGLMGSFPTQNARTADDLAHWLAEIKAGLADVADPQWAVSLFGAGQGVGRIDQIETVREVADKIVDEYLTATNSFAETAR